MAVTKAVLPVPGGPETYMPTSLSDRMEKYALNASFSSSLPMIPSEVDLSAVAERRRRDFRCLYAFLGLYFDGDDAVNGSGSVSVSVSDPDASSELEIVASEDVEAILTNDMRRRAESISVDVAARKGEEEAGGVGMTRVSRTGRALVGVRSTSSSLPIRSRGSTEERDEAGVEGEGEGDRRPGPHE